MKNKIYKVALKHTIDKETAVQLTNELCILLGVSNRFSRKLYDKRQLIPLYFTTDYTVSNVLYLKGEEYSPYNWNYDRMITYIINGILSENSIKEAEVNKNKSICDVDNSKCRCGKSHNGDIFTCSHCNGWFDELSRTDC